MGGSGGVDNIVTFAPEPGTLSLLGLGLAVLTLVRPRTPPRVAKKRTHRPHSTASRPPLRLHHVDGSRRSSERGHSNPAPLGDRRGSPWRRSPSAAWFAIALSRAVPPPAFDAGPAASVLRVPRALPSLRPHGSAKGSASTRPGWKAIGAFFFFGYTYCPDVCPITLGNLRDVRELLAKNAATRTLSMASSSSSSRSTRSATRRSASANSSPTSTATSSGQPDDEEELERLTGALGIHRAKAEGANRAGLPDRPQHSGDADRSAAAAARGLLQAPRSRRRRRRLL